MRTVAMLVVACLVAVAPVRAQDQGGVQEKGSILGIADWVGRGAVRAELQPATQPGRGGRTMFWVGVVMTAGGGAMAGLSGSTLGNRSIDYGGCFVGDNFGDPRQCPDRMERVETNHGFLWGGIAAAGVGITMAIVGKGRQSRSIQLGIAPGGVAVFRKVTF